MPTPSEAAREQLALRTRIINDADAEIAAILQQASDQITVLLANQPTDYQSWYLPQLQQQVKSALTRFAGEAAAVVATSQSAAWSAGSVLVDKVLAAQDVKAVLPVINDLQLRAMTSFLTEKISGITLEAANKINTQLGLVIIGGQTPFDAVKNVQGILNESTRNRARSIVHTELNRAYSDANQARMEQTLAEVPDLEKKWIKSGKVHPRPGHAAINGQRRPVMQPFDLPNGVQLMYPVDPSAPADETINCGCVSVPVVPGWKRSLPEPEKKVGQHGDGVLLSSVS